MDLQTSLLQQMECPTLSRDERAQLCCEIAKKLEESGDYEAARTAMGQLWKRIGERPQLDGLDQRMAAEVLLRAGSLSGWIGSSNQLEGTQEIAKDLISESVAIFDQLQEAEKVAEARVDLAICYWREGAFDEARIILREALSLLADKDSEQTLRALLTSAIIEKVSTRYSDALRIHTEAAPLFAAGSNHLLKGKFHNEFATVLKDLGAAEHREDYIDRALVEYAAASFHFEQAGHKRYRARVENNLGFLFLTTAKFAEAHGHLDHARRLFESLKDKGSVAQVDDTRARAFLGEGRHVEAERIARSAVYTLEKGDEQSLLAEALTTHGTALARVGRRQQARLTLQRAIEVAQQAGDPDGAGLAALTLIEELGDDLSADQMFAVYERADQLLAHSQNSETLTRLRACARRALAAKQHGSSEKFDAPNFAYAAEETATLLRQAHYVASTHGPVLITGETGTGKEVLARMIHEWSGRAGEFVTVNCAALSATLIESELFGRRKGGNGMAAEDHPGAVRRAAGGTLLLDEIGELSLDNQGKLLRLIEHGEIHSIGAPAPERIDVRIIAITNHNLKQMVARGQFRSDLFYRLQTFHFEIPPLRGRPADIPAIAEYFIREACEHHCKRVRVAPAALEAMRRLPLKGNTRELRSLIERAVLMAADGAVITAAAVETIALRQSQQANLVQPWEGCSLNEEVLRYEGNLIKLALEAAGGSITRAARLLGVTHQALSFILQGRHKSLLAARTPAKRRKRSLMRA